MTFPKWGREDITEPGVYRIRLTPNDDDPESWRVFEVFRIIDEEERQKNGNFAVEFRGKRYLLTKFMINFLRYEEADDPQWAKLPEPVEDYLN